MDVLTSPLDWPAAGGYTQSHAGVIQLVECQLPKLDVVGSSPIARSLVRRCPATICVAGHRCLLVTPGRSGNQRVTDRHRFNNTLGLPQPSSRAFFDRSWHAMWALMYRTISLKVY